MHYHRTGAIKYAISSQCLQPPALLQQHLHHSPSDHSPPDQSVQPINLVPALPHDPHPANHLSPRALPRLPRRRLIKHPLGGTNVDNPVDDVRYEFWMALECEDVNLSRCGGGEGTGRVVLYEALNGASGCRAEELGVRGEGGDVVSMLR